jgi:hypothetical protein
VLSVKPLAERYACHSNQTERAAAGYVRRIHGVGGNFRSESSVKFRDWSEAGSKRRSEREWFRFVRRFIHRPWCCRGGIGQAQFGAIGRSAAWSRSLYEDVAEQSRQFVQGMFAAAFECRAVHCCKNFGLQGRKARELLLCHQGER